MAGTYDDDFDAIAKEARGSAPRDGEDEDVLLRDADKPGFEKWAETLATRSFASAHHQSVGSWLPDERVVRVDSMRGKKIASMGFTSRGQRVLQPEEALFLLDDGQMRLMRPGVEFDPDVHVISYDQVVAGAAGGGAEEEEEQEQSAGAGEGVVDCGDDIDFTAAAAAGGGAAAGSCGGTADDAFLPFEAAYSLLLSSLPDASAYAVYSHLKSIGLIAMRHKPLPGSVDAEEALAGSAGGGASSGGSASSVSTGRTPLAPMPMPTLIDLDDDDDDEEEEEADGMAGADAGTASAGASVPGVGIGAGATLGRRERRIVPLYDVYARDGLTPFKLSAPGPPDCYVVLVGPNDPPPTACQLEELYTRLGKHMAAAAAGAAGSGGGGKKKKAPTAAAADGAATASHGGGGGGGGGAGGSIHAVTAATMPDVKFAIVSHATVTFYGAAAVALQLPAHIPQPRRR